MQPICLSGIVVREEWTKYFFLGSFPFQAEQQYCSSSTDVDDKLSVSISDSWQPQ